MRNDKAKLVLALEKARKGFDLLAEAEKILDQLGIDVNNFQFASYQHPNECVLLHTGIGNLSLLSEEMIESDKPYIGYGRIIIDGIVFLQEKLPVERLDRYA